MSNPRTLDAELARQLIRGNEQLTRHPEIGQSRSRGVAWFGGPRIVARKPFYTYKVSNSAVKVTGGVLHRSVTNNDIPIAASESIAVNNGDSVWLERTGNNAWSFNKGAALPTDKLFWQLAQIAIVNGVLTVTLIHPGGNLPHSDTMTVLLTDPAGTGGGDGVDCDFTYTVKSEDGAQTIIASGADPELKPFRMFNTNTVTAATLGTLKIMSDGSLKLWDTNESVTLQYQESDYTPCESQGS